VGNPRPFAIERYFARHEFTARHLLSSSDCEPLTLRELLALADDGERAAFEELRLGYTESPGHPELRARIAALHAGLVADDVLVAMPEEAIYLLGRTQLGPGDRLIVTFPAYQSLYEVASASGAEVVRWTPEESDDGWWFDPDRLADLAQAGAKVIVVNFPHNPTGALPTPEEWRAIVAVAERAGALLVSDEMYRGLEGDPSQRLVSGAVASPAAVTIGGLSKGYGLPGLRVGWLATRDRAVLAAAQAYKDYTTICGSGPSEQLAIVALRHADRLLARCREIVAANRPRLEAFLARHGGVFAWRPPRTAGPIAFVRFRPGEATAFCDRLAEEAGVMLLPSSIFEWGDSHVRFGFGRTSLPDALDALEGYISASGSGRPK
jgi:aspartate/methionine/tyrosine aminotransferase